MIKIKFYTIIGLIIFCTNLKAQSLPLPYYSGFDTPTEKAGWVQYKLGVNGSYGPWTITSGGFSAPSKLYHDYNNTGTVEDWYVSPALNFVSASKISLKIKVHCAGGVYAPDYFGIWCCSGNPDPNQGLYAEIVNLTNLASTNNSWIDTTINLPSIAGTGFIGLKYMNGSNWFDVSIDNITVSALTTGITEEFSRTDNIQIYPNPSSGRITVDLSHYNPFLKGVTMNLYGADGKKQLTKEINTPNEIINTLLPKGYYLYNLIDGTKRIKSGKLIIE